MFTGNRRFQLSVAIALGSALGQESGGKASAVQGVATATPLSVIKQICVDQITGEALVSTASREILLASLFAGKRFIITEKCDRADATLKGAVLSATEKRVRGESESIGFGQAGGSAVATRDSASAAVGGAVGSNGESLFSSESRTQASAVLRLVDREGVVIWATSQESTGGKAKPAIPDVLERAVKQLFRDMDRATIRPSSQP